MPDHFEHPERARIETVYRAAVSLRDIDDPLLAPQIEGVIGRLSALLAVLGGPLPPDAIPPARERAA